MRLSNQETYRVAGYHVRATAKKAFSGSLALTNYEVSLLTINIRVGYQSRAFFPLLIALELFLIKPSCRASKII